MSDQYYPAKAPMIHVNNKPLLIHGISPKQKHDCMVTFRAGWLADVGLFHLILISQSISASLTHCIGASGNLTTKLARQS